MKKIVSIICVFIAFECSFAQSSVSVESPEAMKAKIAKLEAQIKTDMEILRSLRDENRALKREIRKLKRAELSNKISVENKDTAVVSRPKVEKIQPKVESSVSARDYEETQRKESSVWDNMFPF